MNTLLRNDGIHRFPLLRNDENQEFPIVGTHCCATMIWDHISARMTSAATLTLDHINAITTYVMWYEEHIWNASLLQTVAYIFPVLFVHTVARMRCELSPP